MDNPTTIEPTAKAAEGIAYVNLLPGDQAPWFHAATEANPRFAFDTVAGRYIVLGFFGTAGDAVGQRAMKAVAAHRARFDDERLCFFGISVDPKDRDEGRIREAIPGIRFFFDFDAAVSRLYGAAPMQSGDARDGLALRRLWVVLDPTLRVLKVFPFNAEGSEQAQLFAYLDTLPAPDQFVGFPLQAPILFLPNVFEPEFCKSLIDLYEADGGTESGFMREVGGKTVAVMDAGHKRRRDYDITDQQIIRAAQARIKRKVVPEIAKVHQFHVTRMERYIVGCYTAEDGGHFRPHRDNTTKGTAHRRFAISVNLNSEFEGGEVSFPEYGRRSYKPPPGGAVVFSCSLLHTVSKVTKGRRYAFLPFVYDDAAAALREQNNQFLESGTYRS
jgi:peroxiredoxin